MHIEIEERVRQTMRALADGQPLLVGGYVRDRVMAQLGMSVPQSKDVDLEVRLPVDVLYARLQTLGVVNDVGKSFGVFKLTFDDGETYDVSLPRTESKEGTGHRGFSVTGDPSLSIKEAASRRDFTMNAMAANSDGYVLDPFDGTFHIRSRILRHVGPAFSDDPLRVLRGMQFASRFGFVMSYDTVMQSRILVREFFTLSAERIWMEWSKWARGTSPSYGLVTLFQTWWIDGFPELATLKNTPQEPSWHPEGDVWNHTLQAVDKAAAIARREHLSESETEILVFAALLHDIGKPSTTSIINDRITSHGHDKVGAEMARTFLRRMRAPDMVVDHVTRLVAEHMVHAGTHPTPTVLRRLAMRLHPSTVGMLALLCEADASGRHPAPPASPMAQWVWVARTLEVLDNKPQPIVLGRHLIADGFTPGPHFGPLLSDAFQAQLDGQFDDLSSGINWIRSHST